MVSDKEEQYIWDYFDAERFRDIDIMISCGDLKPEYLSFLVTLIKAPLFFVHGNHDKRYEQQPPEGCVSIDGKLINYMGLRILGLGGSYHYNDSKHQYTEKQMKRRIAKLAFKLWINRGFDILVAHAPAFGICDGDDICHRGFKSFLTLIEKYKPKYFIHGHMHMNYKNNKRVNIKGSTKIINAYGYYILDTEKE